MPRDGSNIYHRPPGTDGIPNTTIASTAYNGYVADVEQDLNLPRPIVAGGTGATSGPAALVNLGGEVATQVVTNFDSYPFVSGSFYCGTSTTSAPTANAFRGIAYITDSNNITVEACDNTTGAKYIRQKTTGTWGSWAQQAGSTAVLDAAYVNVTGDTMTGNLTVAATATTGTYYFGSSGTKYLNYDGSNFNLTGGVNLYVSSPIISFLAATPAQGTYGFGNTGTKYLNYDGSNFNLFGGPFIVNNAIAWVGNGQPTGNLYFGSTGTKVLSYDGTNFTFTGGNLILSNNFVVNGNATYHGPSGTASIGNNFYLSGSSGSSGGSSLNYQKNGVTKWFLGEQSSIYGNSSGVFMLYNNSGGPVNTIAVDPASGVTSLFGLYVAPNIALSGYNTVIKIGYAGGATQYGMSFRPVTDGTNNMVFLSATDAFVGAITQTSTSTGYNTSSDGRLKEDLKSFDAGNIVDSTNVYDFAWKTTGERSYGVIGQQAIEVYPAAVTYTKEQDWYGVDYSKYVPVLLQELKALRARVAQLEAKAA